MVRDWLSWTIIAVLGLVVFHNFRRGTLRDWVAAKFFNASEPPPVNDGPVGVSSSVYLEGSAGGWTHPLPSGRITSRYGVNRGTHRHGGLDFGAPTGTPIRAARAGLVTHAGARGSYGLMVELDHGGGTTTRYAHMHRVSVSRGQKVRAGDKLGEVGSTGRSSGPHLHFEIRRNGNTVDPEPELAGAGSRAVSV